MLHSPYRRSTPPREGAPPAPADADLVVPFAMLWILSIVQVARAHTEPFGTIDVLAALSIAGLPALMRGPLRELSALALGALRRRRARATTPGIKKS